MQSTIIPQKDYDAFCKANSQFNCRRGLRFSDGTMRVILEDIVGPEEQDLTIEELEKRAQDEWEATRQMYLRVAKTDGKKAWEGEAEGYLTYNQYDAESLLWVDAFCNYEQEQEIKDWMDLAEERYQCKSDFLEQFDQYPEWNDTSRKKRREKTHQAKDLATKLRRWENQFWDSEVSIDTILRKLSNTGIIGRIKSLTQEDQRDYAGHAFGLYNTGCAQIEDRRLVFNGIKTANYIEEHFVRRIMSEDVALEFLRKLGYCKKKDYSTLDKDERRDLVRQLLKKAKLVETEIETKRLEAIRRTKDLVKTHFPAVAEVFPDFKVVLR